MKKVLIINGHQYYPFSEGKLNAALVDITKEVLTTKGYEIKEVNMKDEYNVEEEVEKHLWADIVILQTPINWMGITWSFKKYMDEVYTTGMFGQLCNGDGRSEAAPKKNYGTGGLLTDSKYMMSVTFNAPSEAFDNEDEYLFGGKGVDNLLFPQHMNFRFFGMKPLPTFACFDVMKNPDIENDFKRFREHLEQNV
ncbi:NAD(P)H-dependent oxidoreductase [Limibacter armeniacum]|uniref:NAD(P)H-dependent oxidoreductase n=1 Tax=Limibacter armeniacum TaxID=466084 RepID=UPI002FE5F9A0